MGGHLARRPAGCKEFGRGRAYCPGCNEILGSGDDSCKAWFAFEEFARAKRSTPHLVLDCAKGAVCYENFPTTAGEP